MQRGFLFDAKAEKTYVHRRKGVIHPASIADVAAQRFFYSRLSSDGSKTLDDKITDYENRLGGLLISLRSVDIDGAVDPALAAEVIAHLTPRSANMRRMFGSGMQQLMTAAAEAFSDEDTVVQMLGLSEPGPNAVWNEHISRMFDKEPQLKTMLDLLQLPDDLLERLIFMAAKEHFLGRYGAKSLGIMEAFTSVLDGLDDIVRDGHNKALGNGLVAMARKESLEALEWRIRAAPPEGAILPDCVAIGADDEGGTFFPYMMTNTASVSAVVMPITSTKLLVGVRVGHAAPVLSDFNKDASACSDELFITASSASVFAEISANLGERWSAEIDAVVQGALKDILPNKKSARELSGEPPPLSPLSYQLSFTGLGTDEEITPLSEKTQRLVGQIRPLFDLDRLDGITFAADHEAALTELERGFDVNVTPEGMPEDIAQGVSTAVVLRDGVLKVRIVMHAAYGQALVANDVQDAEVALHFLVAGLAQACTLNRIEKALPEFLMTPVMMSDHDGVLHCAVRKAIRAYRYARDSTEFGADDVVEEEFSKYLISTFDSATTALKQAKEAHAQSENFPVLFEAAHGMASNMLISAARLIGHRHGMGQLGFPGAETEVGAVMASRQLTNWIEVFSKDLQRFWQKDQWTRKDFYALNIHAERVLWANGIVLWREPNGQGTMIMAAPHNAASLQLQP
ncbi:hypothetical protein HPO_13010 [Hyphomonas polymorpha PS728]|uniref:Uncharacterized protein n=1 Tax=Hyphomonas polymorpha PS728 TaxID=1280954 RepID=A0A062VGX2_9PROT|nr:hypothetical protein HPO_13010 [Hyphomonas polymorpha PS728]